MSEDGNLCNAIGTGPFLLEHYEPTPALPRGLAEWSLPIDQLGEGAKYYQYNPKEAKRLLAEAGHPKGLQTQLTVQQWLWPRPDRCEAGLQALGPSPLPSPGRRG